MKKYKRDCLETYGLDFITGMLMVVLAVLAIGFFVMLGIEAIKDLLGK